MTEMPIALARSTSANADAVEERIAELENEVAKQRLFIDILLPTMVGLCERVGATTRIVLPPNWLLIKEAAIVVHYSLPTMYRFHHKGVIDSQELGGKIAVDVSTLAARIAEYRAKRKTRK